MSPIIIIPSYDPTPNLIMGLQGSPIGVGSSRGTQGNGIDVDAAGNFVMVGYFNPVAGAFPRYGLVTYYNASGEHQWSRAYRPNGSSDHTLYDCKFDTSGNIAVCGYDGQTADLAVLRFDTSGNALSQRRFDRGNTPGGYGLDIDPNDGSIYVAGESLGDRGILLKLSADSSVITWARSFFQGNSGNAEDVAVHTNGNVAVVGNSYNGIFGSSRTSMWIVLLDSSGTKIWSRGLGFSGDHQQGTGVDFDSSGNVYAIGWDSSAAESMMVVKYSPTGTLLWIRRIAQGSTRAYDITIGPDGNPWVVGATRVGDDNYIVMKLNASDGSTIYGRRFGTVSPGFGDDVGRSIALNPGGDAYVTGNAGNDAQHDGLQTNCEHLMWGKFPRDGSGAPTTWNSNDLRYADVSYTNVDGSTFWSENTNPPDNTTSISPANNATAYTIDDPVPAEVSTATPVQD